MLRIRQGLLLAMLAIHPACVGQEEATARPPAHGPWDGAVSGDSSAEVSGDTSTAADGQADAVPDQVCVPRTCAQLGAECGSAPDGCGATVECGACSTGQNCGGGGPNKCGAGTCTPKTCTQMGASCGLVSDGCGATLSCGQCVAPETCGGSGADNQCGCKPKTCGELGAECGTIADGCGAVIDCGACAAGKVCGGAGTNKCGDAPCTPKTCQSLGAGCGQHPDGCSGTLDCGACSAPNTCGGGGNPLQCGCSPTSCAAQAAQCGSIPNGCGGALGCGTCQYGSCQGNKCSCSPTTCAAQGAQCGSIPNGCGGTLSCPNCPGNQSCNAGHCGCGAGQHLCGVNCIADGTCCTDADCSGLTVCSTPGAACACRTSPARQAIFRSYAYWNGDHFFSPNQSEGPAAGYQDEGVRYYDYAGPCQWGLVPFHRLTDPSSGEHFYTASVSEKDGLVASGWWLEGDIGCIADTAVCGAVPLYRLAWTMHMFTTDAGERDALVSQGWMLEGPAAYVWLGP